MNELLQHIRVVSDFPTKGIEFYDITTLLNDAKVFQKVIEQLIQIVKPWNIEVVVALEARGFIFAPALALALKVPFVPIRKKGKLPAATYTVDYDLEYSSASVQIHQDAIKKNQNVLIFDDILATGGTAKAANELVQLFEPKNVHFLFVLELLFLQGRDKINAPNIFSLLHA